MNNTNQRIVVGMIDGFGLDYYAAQPMPNLQRMASTGVMREVKAVMPTVTNVNNVSISCSSLPSEHGLTGNSYYNVATGEADYMENSGFLLRPTISQRAAAHGIKSALLTCKQKTINLLASGADIAIAAENPPPDYVERFGPPPDIYSREINYWLWEVAIDLLQNRPDIGVVYVHTTDYPMHAWAPEREESQEHLRRLDQLMGDAAAAAPDAAFFITADHGMNFKSRCWDLGKALHSRGTAIRFALSAEKDRYIKHHRTFGGAAYVWLNDMADVDEVKQQILLLPGIEAVRTREEAARDFNLMPDRIGDLVVTGDRETVFGEMECEMERLELTYRSHGSLHELDVPLFVYNWKGTLPAPEEFIHNADLLHFVLP